MPHSDLPHLSPRKPFDMGGFESNTAMVGALLGEHGLAGSILVRMPDGKERAVFTSDVASLDTGKKLLEGAVAVLHATSASLAEIIGVTATAELLRRMGACLELGLVPGLGEGSVLITRDKPNGGEPR